LSLKYSIVIYTKYLFLINNDHYCQSSKYSFLFSHIINEYFLKEDLNIFIPILFANNTRQKKAAY